MNVLIKSALGLCFAALSMNHALAADDSEIDMTCDSEKPVIMLVAGRTLDAAVSYTHLTLPTILLV